jgi:hypothetical protein
MVPVLVSEFTDHVAGWRVIATPAALDAAPWPAGSQVVRISPDDAYVIGATEPTVPADAHAIVTPEFGFSLAVVHDVTALAEQHIEWQLPTSRPALAQGQIAGVPAKLVLHADGSAQLLVASAARHELQERLS